MNTTKIIPEQQAFSFTCKLTTPELQHRKKTIIAALQSCMLEKKELDNGFAYRFKGADEIIDKLITFIKTEKLCCDFFNYTLSISSDEVIWLELTGPSGVKNFIKAELDL